jgi:hypothetical protein
MTRRRLFRIALICIAVLFLGVGGLVLRRAGVDVSFQQQKPTKKNRDPNVIFIVLDVVRADHLSVCGYHRPTSSALDQLVNEGAFLTCRAYSPGTWTLPSHASFFTGEEVPVHRADFTLSPRGDNTLSVSGLQLCPLGNEFPTLAEKMKAAGYQTLAVSGNPVVSNWSQTGLLRGFELTRESMAFGDLYGPDLESMVKDAVLHIDEKRPTFFFVNICDAHVPWLPVPPGIRWLNARLGMQYLPQIPTNPFGRFFRGEMNEGEKTHFLQRATDLYDYAVFRADSTLERVLRLLSDKGLFKGDFRLVIVSDHGEMLGEHELMSHGVYTYEPGTRVPLLYLDQNRTPIKMTEPISALHAYDLVLNGYLPDKPRPARSVGYPVYAPLKWFGNRHQVTMVSRWSGHEKLTWKNGDYMLIDLNVDPQELDPKPLPDNHPLREEFSEFVDEVTESVNTNIIEPTPQMIEALRKLGYLK